MNVLFCCSMQLYTTIHTSLMGLGPFWMSTFLGYPLTLFPRLSANEYPTQLFCTIPLSSNSVVGHPLARAAQLLCHDQGISTNWTISWAMYLTMMHYWQEVLKVMGITGWNPSSRIKDSQIRGRSPSIWEFFFLLRGLRPVIPNYL